MIKLNNFAKRHCITHKNFSKTFCEICAKCGYEKNHVFNEVELKQIDENLDKSKRKLIDISSSLEKKKMEFSKKISQYDNFIRNLTGEYENITSKDTFEGDSYINNILFTLENIIGKNNNINMENIFLFDNVYIIDHNYLGGLISKKIIINDLQFKKCLSKVPFGCIIEKHKNIYYDLF